MTGFLCSLGGVCLTSLQPIRYCIVTSNFKFASEPSGLQCASLFLVFEAQRDFNKWIVV